MKKGILLSLIYYAIVFAIYFLLGIYTEAPRHSPGIDYLFLGLMFYVAVLLIIYYLVSMLLKKNRARYKGMLLIHITFVLTLIIIIYFKLQMVNNSY
jgi:hypothetical protein